MRVFVRRWAKVGEPVGVFSRVRPSPLMAAVPDWMRAWLSKGVFTRENSHRREFHTGMTFWFRIAFTLWLGHFISRYLKEHFMLIKYSRDSKSQTLRMRFPFQSTDKQISHRNVWSFRVYMSPLRDFAPGWNSRPGTTTGVNSRRGDSRRHDVCVGIM